MLNSSVIRALLTRTLQHDRNLIIRYSVVEPISGREADMPSHSNKLGWESYSGIFCICHKHKNVLSFSTQQPKQLLAQPLPQLRQTWSMTK